MEAKKGDFYELIFDNIDGKIMEIIIEYLHYKARYLNTPIDKIPSFKIEPAELGLDVLKAAIDLKLWILKKITTLIFNFVQSNNL